MSQNDDVPVIPDIPDSANVGDRIVYEAAQYVITDKLWHISPRRDGHAQVSCSFRYERLHGWEYV